MHVYNYVHGNRSANYRTIKLFFIGKEGRGKTTLQHRLRSIPIKDVKQTVTSTIGIDIEKWCYPDSRKDNPRNVHFLIWDFAGQVIIILVRVMVNRPHLLHIYRMLTMQPISVFIQSDLSILHCSG